MIETRKTSPHELNGRYKGLGGKPSQRGLLVAARLEYIKKHGAAFLFNNTAPPAPGYPRGGADV